MNLLSGKTPAGSFFPSATPCNSRKLPASSPSKDTGARENASSPCRNGGCRAASFPRMSGHAAEARTQKRILSALTRAPRRSGDVRHLSPFPQKARKSVQMDTGTPCMPARVHTKAHNGSARAKPDTDERESVNTAEPVPIKVRRTRESARRSALLCPALASRPTARRQALAATLPSCRFHAYGKSASKNSWPRSLFSSLPPAAASPSPVPQEKPLEARRLRLFLVPRSLLLPKAKSGKPCPDDAACSTPRPAVRPPEASHKKTPSGTKKGTGRRRDALQQKITINFLAPQPGWGGVTKKSAPRRERPFS